MDYQTVLYGPNYLILGVPASVRLGDTDYPLTAIDKTMGIVVGSGVDLQTVLPAAVVRMNDLVKQGIRASELDGQDLTMNGKVWRISSTRPKPSPHGEADGELYLILEGDDP